MVKQEYAGQKLHFINVDNEVDICTFAQTISAFYVAVG